MVSRLRNTARSNVPARPEVNQSTHHLLSPAFVRRFAAQRGRQAREGSARLAFHNSQVPISSHSSLPESIASTSAPFPSVIEFPTEGVNLRDPYTYEEGDIGVEELGVPNEPMLHLPAERHFLGRMDVVCNFCQDLHWHAERLSNSTFTTFLFGLCCLQGKIVLPPLSLFPLVL
ncbi:hypothetical protein AQUCO_10500015v1 [Aquilegia coerulea]|uniref:Uncharacterized protein n=1 Tax=Aquilegia coerulea TaxID=218851 RepID=A0A2G5C3Q8_AQUCA|nr:hypothetical protein AQUCO_10500015v1 [Aquilegia coerulea]